MRKLKGEIPSYKIGRQDILSTLIKNKMVLFSIAILLIIISICIFGPLITKYGFMEINSSALNNPPSTNHIFGTDDLGRDIFARICAGGRVSLTLAITGALISGAVGVFYGSIAGYFGGLVDDILMRIVEVISTIPYLLVVIIISLFTGRGILSLIFAMTVTGWVSMARIVRGQVLKIKEEEYVLAAKALGADDFWIIFKHIIPNTSGIIIVAFTFDIPVFIFGEAFLSFIGLGIQPPNTSWGAMAALGQQNIMFYPYQLFFPALFISLTILSFNLLGDGVKDALDPKEV